jgi:hypothetical protein
VITPWRGWGLAAYLVCSVFALVIAWALFHVPFQLSDNAAQMLQLQRTSLFEQIAANFSGGAGYMRPFMWGLLKVVFEASAGHLFVVFRAFQGLQVLASVWLFVRVLGVHSFSTFAVAPLGTAMLLGFPTFRGLVIEAFPINTYLTIAGCALAAVNLTIARPSWKVDVAAVLLFLYAVLTVENGILLWPLFVMAFVVGLRGVSLRGVIATTACVGWYLAHRALFLAAATPGLSERPSGFAFRLMEPQDLVARFGDNPLPFYAYNIVTSPLAVLFAEPRRGIFHFVGQWMEGQFWPGTVLTVSIVTLTTLIMLTAAAARLRRWRRHGLTRADQMVLIFLGVLAANAVVSFPYQKDEIMSVAGVLYAIAATVSLQAITEWFAAAPRRPLVSILAGVMMLALGTGWSLRYLDLLYHLNLTAVRNQADWLFEERWNRANRINERYPQAPPFLQELRREAIAMPVPHPFAYRAWERYSDTR